MSARQLVTAGEAIKVRKPTNTSNAYLGFLKEALEAILQQVTHWASERLREGCTEMNLGDLAISMAKKMFVNAATVLL
jgi:hypothetical protein